MKEVVKEVVVIVGLRCARKKGSYCKIVGNGGCNIPAASLPEQENIFHFNLFLQIKSCLACIEVD